MAARSLVAFLTFEQSPVNFTSPLPISFQPTFNLSANVIILAWRWANKRVRRQRPRPLTHSFTRVWLLNLLLSPSLPLSLSGATTDRHMLDIHERRADAYIHKHPRPRPPLSWRRRCGRRWPQCPNPKCCVTLSAIAAGELQSHAIFCVRFSFTTPPSSSECKVKSAFLTLSGGGGVMEARCDEAIISATKRECNARTRRTKTHSTSAE